MSPAAAGPGMYRDESGSCTLNWRFGLARSTATTVLAAAVGSHEPAAATLDRKGDRIVSVVNDVAQAIDNRGTDQCGVLAVGKQR